MKITYIDGCYKITANEADLNISFKAENIEAGKRHYLDIIGEIFDNGVNMGLLDLDAMDCEKIPLSEQLRKKCSKFSNALSKIF